MQEDGGRRSGGNGADQSDGEAAQEPAETPQPKEPAKTPLPDRKSVV